MTSKWKLEYYQDTSGAIPVQSFIESLTAKTQAKVIDALNLLEEFGTEVRYPHVDSIIATSIREVRILGKDNIRIFYTLIAKHTFLLLHGFIKKTQKTPSKEISIALKRIDYFKNNN